MFLPSFDFRNVLKYYVEIQGAMRPSFQFGPQQGFVHLSQKPSFVATIFVPPFVTKTFVPLFITKTFIPPFVTKAFVPPFATSTFVPLYVPKNFVRFPFCDGTQDGIQSNYRWSHHLISLKFGDNVLKGVVCHVLKFQADPKIILDQTKHFILLAFGREQRILTRNGL